MPTIDPYDTLGVGRDADEAAIRRAYRSRAKSAHPDTGGSPEEFARLRTALAVLSSPERRARYDETGRIDEPEADPDAQAWNVIAEALMGVVQGEGDPVTIDLVAHLRRCFGQRAAALRNELAPMERALARTEKLRDRFRNAKGGADRLSPMIEWQIAHLERPVMAKRAHIAAVERAAEIVGDYEFRADPARAGVQVYNLAGAGTSTSSTIFG